MFVLKEMGILAAQLTEGITRLLVWIMKFSVINLIWVTFCLPIIFITIPVFFADDASGVFTVLLFLSIMAPFFFFPATMAMFGVVRKWVIGVDDVPLFFSFWKIYKENYKRSFLSGIFITFVFAILTLDIYYFSTINPMISGLFIIALFFSFHFMIFFFANSVHTTLSFWDNMKNSMILSLINPVYNLCILFINVIILYVSFQLFTAFIPFFMGTTIAFVSFKGYYHLFRKVQESSKI